MKAFADDNLNVAQVIEFVFERFENRVAKLENADYQHFLLFPLVFEAFLIRFIKTLGLCCKHLTLSQTTNFRLFTTERVCRRQF